MLILPDSDLPFEEYIKNCKAYLKQRRPVFNSHSISPDLILETNSPYELRPPGQQKCKVGVLLVHGLFDCPFSIKDLGMRLKDNGVLCRAVLLPGHGTLPDDLITVKSEEWINTVRYGINSFRNQVEQLYILGYSTGGTLAIHQALCDTSIAGLILIAPAIKIRVPIDPLLDMPYLTNWFNVHRQWLYRRIETDYTKYLSVAFNAVKQVSVLTTVTTNMQTQKKIQCPMFMAMSKNDQVVSCYNALELFKKYQHERSRFILYATSEEAQGDKRIEVRKSDYPELNIRDFSHICMPFSPGNPHYGQQGDYPEASRIGNTGVIYGSYNHLETHLYRWLYNLGLMRFKRKELTYNPDFDYMAEGIVKFVI